MLEGLATWVLNTYLGQYLENLNTDQLSIGLLNGEVELENVPLRKDALRNLDMSLEIYSGFIGKIKLQIPVSHLRSEPWIIIFEQLYLVAGPIDLSSYNVEAEETEKFKRKMEQLDHIEAIWRSEQECHINDSYGSSYMSWLAFGTSFVTNIIENIQLRIQDVHIRYEDSLSKPGEIFAGGLTIESLTMQSSDEHWVPKFVSTSDKEFSFKIMELKNCGIYWDTSSERLSDKSIGDLAAAMVSSKAKDHQYVMQMVSASACLKRNLDLNPLRSRSTPRFTCDLKFEKIPLFLNDLQYDQLTSSLSFYERLEVTRPHRKWRPKDKPIRNNARLWWNYAIHCHLQKIKRKYMMRNWISALNRAKEINHYFSEYCKHLRDPSSVPVDMRNRDFKLEHELSFNELKALRDICMDLIAKEKSTKFTEESTSNVTEPSEGILQSWFPGWTGWYSQKIDHQPTDSSTNCSKVSSDKAREAVSQLEEEILYVISDSMENNTFMKRDAVFAQLSFSLKKGSIVLQKFEDRSSGANAHLESKSSTLFELDFSNVNIECESRPRHNSYLFKVQLGSICLKDQVTANTNFPLIISQQREGSGYFKGPKGMSSSLSTAGMYAKFSSMMSSVSRTNYQSASPAAPAKDALFLLIYEKNPSKFHKIENRLEITSQVLDVVYNQRAFEAIFNFFFPRQHSSSFYQNWSAKQSYEELKRQTKEGLTKNWKSLLQGIMGMEQNMWDIQLNISAPQIIFPERFSDPNATVVIMDFGKLLFCTSHKQSHQAGKVEQVSLDSDNEEFATPCSTPEEIPFKGKHSGSLPTDDGQASNPDQATFHKHLYDKFDLKLCDMQVLVAKIKDDWRFACQKGTGLMHVIDRFNINLHLERRIVGIVTDGDAGSAQWPNLILSGNLPQLVVHVNETKVEAVKTIFSKYIFSSPKRFSHQGSPSKFEMKDPTSVEETEMESSQHSQVFLNSNMAPQSKVTKESEDNFSDSWDSLIVMQFNVEKLSIELQSRGRSIAELQVTGVKAQVSKRPLDISASLSVSSLLLVDALQSFGSDFELLIASHKHISMDSVSGSLLDSDPCSPVSPASPDSSVGKCTSPVALSQALNSLAFNSNKITFDSCSPRRVKSPHLDYQIHSLADWNKDTEALINFEIAYIIHEVPENSESSNRYIYSSLRFNALDIIANQETLVELIGFIHQICAPVHQHSSRDETDKSTNDSSEENYTESKPLSYAKPYFHDSLTSLYKASNNIFQLPKSSLRSEINFDFQKLTILLLRGAIKEKSLVGRKVGTAVLSQAKIEVCVDKEILSCEGFLGGFQIRDVTPEGSKYQCILSVGSDPMVQIPQDCVQKRHAVIYQSSESIEECSQKAFSFKIVRPLVFSSKFESMRDPSDCPSEYLDEFGTENKICIHIRMASVCYTHSPHFLLEVNSCAQEFRQYMAKVVSSIKQAATEVAIGLVSKRIESFSSLPVTGWDSPPRRQNRPRHISLSRSMDIIIPPRAPPSSTYDSTCISPTQEVVPDLSFNTKLDIVLETPIVVLPHSSNSANVVVAHLGQISIRNKPNAQVCNDSMSQYLSKNIAIFDVLVKDMSLFTLNVDEKLRTRDITFHPLSVTMMNAEELYNCKEHGSPILHSTSIELTFEQHKTPELLTDSEVGFVFPADFCTDQQSSQTSDSFVVTGGIVTPLKLSVSRPQYLLLCQTLTSLSSDNTKSSYPSQDLDPILEESDIFKKVKHEPPKRIKTNSSLFSSVQGKFTIPSLCIELRGVACETERPLANLVLNGISAFYETREKYVSNSKITLCSLEMEDLHSNSEVESHNILMKSENISPVRSSNMARGVDISNKTASTSFIDDDFLSVSCPEMWYDTRASELASHSLPSKLEMEKPFYKNFRKSKERMKRKTSVKENRKVFHGRNEKNEYPVTPPPSPINDDFYSSMNSDTKETNALVNINISSIDPRCPDFMNKYDGNNRLVNIKLSSLVTVVNLESWVMVLDFFRSDESSEKKEFNATGNHEFGVPSENKIMEDTCSVTEIHMESVKLLLNTTGGELASFVLNQVSLKSLSSPENLTLSGKLGSLSLIDSTPYGSRYKQKFSSVGDEAMIFQIFRYGNEDPDLLRKCDIRLKLKMSSILYVHSHRFVQELTQFFQQFLLLRDKLSNWRALNAGLKVNEHKRGTRVSLDISAGSPVIFIPMSSQSDDVMVVDLGSLSISNQFLWSGHPKTISKVRRADLFDRLADSRSDAGLSSFRSRSRSGNKRNQGKYLRLEKKDSVGPKCLLDVMDVKLINMDLFLSQRTISGADSKPTSCSSSENMFWDLDSFIIVRKGSSLLKTKCALSLQVDRNLDGEISKIVPDISVQGLLTKIHLTINVSSYKLIRGILAHNIGEPIREMELHPIFVALQKQHDSIHRKAPIFSTHVWTSLNIEFDLNDVIVDAEWIDENEQEFTRCELPCFARVNLIKSKLIYESFSDSSKDIDLVSQEILICDTRYEDLSINRRPNVFSNVLSPAHDQDMKNENPLQAEVHYRSTREITRFTILLNNMRLMAILDWLQLVLTFIQSSPSMPRPSTASCEPSISDSRRDLHLHHSKPGIPKLNPMVESTGLMTKHSLISEEYQVPFELKLNITDSELVIVENSSCLDTAAIILKTTAVLSYRPQLQERPVSCNLNQCELYSCNLGFEDSTALSIIDPVTINIEVNDRSIRDKNIDLTHISVQSQHTVDITLHQLNVRLSYHDLKIFLGILESLPRQKEAAMERKGSQAPSEDFKYKEHIDVLSSLGFSSLDCQRGLKECRGNVDEAALWLTENAERIICEKGENQMEIRGFELKTGGVNLTIIDDCGDCDVPLLEFCFSHLNVKQDFEWKGSASCSFSIDYYNRALSSWEPFVEPWRARSEWLRFIHGETYNQRHVLRLSVVSDDVINLTLTSTLLDLYNLVKTNWTEDYYKRKGFTCEDGDVKADGSAKGARKRQPFIPFAMKNETGCDISFYRLTQTSRSLGCCESIIENIKEENWESVSSGETVCFAFERKSKKRPGKSHSFKSHRLMVKVGNWNPVGPVTVDKVGVFHRLAQGYNSERTLCLPKVRILFDISMDGLAKKLICVRSTLTLINRLPQPIELKLVNTYFKDGGVMFLRTSFKGTISIPLNYLWSLIYVKPLPQPTDDSHSSSVSKNGFPWGYCRDPIICENLPFNDEELTMSRICSSVHNKLSSCKYRFYAHVLKENFSDEHSSSRSDSLVNSQLNIDKSVELVQPGHMIVLVSSFTITNLLPFDLHYELGSTEAAGRIKSGENEYISAVDPEKELELSLWIDNFRSTSTLLICPSTSYSTSLKLIDASDRCIRLQIQVSRIYGKALKIKVSAYFWFINKTGLPIVFKQEGSTTEAAGQGEEHELARNAAPLLFSFSDPESAPMIAARVGKYLHLDSIAHFCKKFPLTQGNRVRRLHVSRRDNRPDVVYEVGINVRPGRGKYRDTYIVTFSPRILIANRSSKELLISQKCCTTTTLDRSSSESLWLRAKPACWLPFHWPRLDKDPLLCVYLCDTPSGKWSGGIFIGETNSFHINIRDGIGSSHFLRVEILMSDATFFVVFTDPESLPTPFRLDNFSFVPLTYYQTGTHEDYMRSVIKNRSSVAYALDEVTQPPYLTCVAPGGSSATYDMNILGEGANITYENFIYIAFSGTFKDYQDCEDKDCSEQRLVVSTEYNSLNFVFDVEGSRVFVARKEIGRRSQLWRMTSSGMLQHEGSSPPFDPASKKPRNDINIWVLDIAGQAPLPSEYTPLMLRKPDPRRRLTQTWRFTEDGRLCCQHSNMFVQAKDSFIPGNDVVLGPPQFIHYGFMSNGLPVEQAVGRQKLRPGSGVLSVQVVMDGPTRVLQIKDMQNKNLDQVISTESGEFVHADGGVTSTARSRRSIEYPQANCDLRTVENDFQIQLELEKGIGLSVVHFSEELFYGRFSNIVLEYLSSPLNRKFDCTIKDIQVDNQLAKAQCPVPLYMTSQSKNDESRHLPALQISFHLLRSPNFNAFIFKHLLINMKPVTFTIEETLLCKCLFFLGLDKQHLQNDEESVYETKRMLAAATSANAIRFYFTHLQMVLNQVRLSVLTSSNLSAELRSIRRKQGLSLVPFENAVVSLDPFVRWHPFQTSRSLIDSIKAHYEKELRSQAMIILGSTDFLGNPIGLLGDVSEGIQELVRDGSFGGLMKNVTHGMANSTAKFTGTLSNAVGHFTMDSRYEELRQRYLREQYRDSPDHFVSGLMGFGLGLYGGITSIVSQTYTGASREGLPGFFSGFAKGMVGTVTKPAIGFLDLAAGTASAVRETSKNPAHKLPAKIRKPRRVIGENSSLPRYSEKDALGQELMMSFDSTSSQTFFGYEVLQAGDDDLRALITSEEVLFFSFANSSDGPTLVLRVKFRDLYVCRPVTLEWEVSLDEPSHYIELTTKAKVTTSSLNLMAPTMPPELLANAPRVRCDSISIATNVCDKINFARTLYEELSHTFFPVLLEEEEN